MSALLISLKILTFLGLVCANRIDDRHTRKDVFHLAKNDIAPIDMRTLRHILTQYHLRNEQPYNPYEFGSSGFGHYGQQHPIPYRSNYGDNFGPSKPFYGVPPGNGFGFGHHHRPDGYGPPSGFGQQQDSFGQRPWHHHGHRRRPGYGHHHYNYDDSNEESSSEENDCNDDREPMKPKPFPTRPPTKPMVAPTDEPSVVQPPTTVNVPTTERRPSTTAAPVQEFTSSTEYPQIDIRLGV